MQSQSTEEKSVCLFGNIGAGHLAPMLALAEQLTMCGWKVFFYAHANARQKVIATGAVWRNYGSDDWDLFNTAQWATTNLLNLGAEPLQDLSIVRAAPAASIAMLPYLLKEIELHRPAFTIHDAAAPWGYLAGQIAGVPTVCSMTAFPMTIEHTTLNYPNGPIQQAAVRHLRERYRVEYDPANCYLNYSGFNLVFTARAWAGNGNGSCNHNFCVAPPLEAEIEHPSIELAKAAKSAGRKVVYASFGTVVNGKLRKYYAPVVYRIFDEAIEALRDRDDVQLIISEGIHNRADFAPEAKTLRERVSVFDYVPQPQLLKYVDVFVMHGGMNSTNEAAWHGVPVVCCPFFGDGPLNARRFEELGAGVTIDYDIATPAEVAAGQPVCRRDASLQPALFSLLDDPSYRRAATTLMEQFRSEPCVAETVDRMLAWVADNQ